MSYLHGKFVWFEHASGDPAAAARFYGALLGWATDAFPMGEGQSYTSIKNGDQAIGGIVAAPAGQRSAWMSYLSVADVDASAAAAQAAGAKLLMPPTDFPPAGRGAALADPTGAAFSVWKSAQGDAPDVETVPDGSWYWNELWTADDAAALAFYEGQFGFTHESMDMGPGGQYHILMKDGRSRAGMTKSAQPGAPSLWLPYVMVASTDATLAKARSLGAEQLVAATDIPNIGRFAIVADPLGAAVAFINRP